ncbi:choline dehydrogenase-like flavoprotein [Catenulispora sp. GP43]|uniref:GMC oxidoreductase n=1 Tax=Catenulispora sp. GP43 TaxID=3156263 RepID=UPI00351872F8
MATHPLITWPDGTGAIPRTCRIAIVGAGLAGLEIAKELGRAGVTDVLVLESGPVGDPRHNNTAASSEDALRAWLAPGTDRYFDRPWESADPPHYTSPGGRRRRLGGRSLYWYGICLPIEDWALTAADWPAAVVSDLVASWRGGPSLYERIREQLAAWRTPKTPWPAFGAEPETGDLGGFMFRRTPMAVSRDAGGADRWYAYSALDTWRDPVTGGALAEMAGIRILTGADVTGVVVRDGAARGVLIRDPEGSSMEITAEQVVLAAGTLENSRLGAQALYEAGALTEPRLTGLADHIVQGFFLKLSGAPARRILERLGPGDHFAAGPESSRSNLFTEMIPLGDDGVLVDIRATGEQLPDERTAVVCEPASRGPWPMRVHAVPSDADLALIAAQREMLQTVHDDIARITGCVPSHLDFGSFTNPARTNAFVLPEDIGAAPRDVAVTWSSHLGVEDHEGGTLPLGRILDDDQGFRAVRGLSAAGPSTFPRLGAANPSLTTLALAHRLAAILADRS